MTRAAVRDSQMRAEHIIYLETVWAASTSVSSLTCIVSWGISDWPQRANPYPRRRQGRLSLITYQSFRVQCSRSESDESDRYITSRAVDTSTMIIMVYMYPHPATFSATALPSLPTLASALFCASPSLLPNSPTMASMVVLPPENMMPISHDSTPSSC